LLCPTTHPPVLLWLKHHPHGNLQKSYHIPPLKTVLLWKLSAALPNSNSNPNAVTTLWRKMPLPIFTYSVLPLARN
jgi:hypothetical protein